MKDHLRRHLFASAALIVLPGAASAADLASLKPISAPPSWAGFYLGLHGGYGWSKDPFRYQDANLSPGNALSGVRGKGAIYGGQFGFNWQYGRIITGAELDFSAANISGSVSATEIDTAINLTRSASLHEAVKHLGTARLRTGWTPTDAILLYGTAGLAWERLDLSARATQNAANLAFSDVEIRTPLDKFGWVAGLGVEAALGGPNWIGRLEYLHYDFGRVTNAGGMYPGGPPLSTAGSQNIDLVRAGLSYKFGRQAAPSDALAFSGSSPQLSSWAGYYLGAHAGYAWGDHPYALPLAWNVTTATDVLTGIRSRGWIAGAHMGHNWQFGRVVTGVEVDLDDADIKGKTTSGTYTITGVTTGVTQTERIAYLGTARGRLGWSASDNLMLYGTAGLAWERYEQITDAHVTQNGASGDRHSVTPSDRFGFVVGTGAEMKLGASGWTGRVEYLHYDFGQVLPTGSLNIMGGGTSLASNITGGRQTIDLVRSGISYSFGSGIPDALASTVTSRAPLSSATAGWEGLYFGVHAGYGWKKNDFANVLATDVMIGGIHSRGAIGGGHAGYNWQIGGAVAGFELDGSATGIKGSSAAVTVGDTVSTRSDDVQYLGTMRARLGWAPIGQFLLYGTGGLAWERAHRLTNAYDNLSGVTRTGETPRDHFGWAAGVGGEIMLSADRKWTGRIEYLHYDFGAVESATTTSSATGFVADRPGRQTIDMARAGVSYRFTP